MLLFRRRTRILFVPCDREKVIDEPDFQMEELPARFWRALALWRTGRYAYLVICGEPGRQGKESLATRMAYRYSSFGIPDGHLMITNEVPATVAALAVDGEMHGHRVNVIDSVISELERRQVGDPRSWKIVVVAETAVAFGYWRSFRELYNLAVAYWPIRPKRYWSTWLGGLVMMVHHIRDRRRQRRELALEVRALEHHPEVKPAAAA